MTALNWSSFLVFLGKYNHRLLVEVDQGRSLTVCSVRINYSRMSIAIPTLQALSAHNLL
ncbi:hypothetical protein [aff. Roholtiella sp. LEGE 12411]|uniref:hypothetical protein n=1 Tax=aff. Roholtiella sp. LEGE 12411 TaxID=1828822 RepID=UPI0018812000|nr:hypothetical protein [aff. Roholtiella sp. LEGE 12411]MBE9037396.1 hypothetical protein [aff. Roholtiella sp. LEGE 12411]